MFLFLREHAISKLDANYENDTFDTNVINFSHEKFPDLEEFIGLVDVIVTDYSGIYLEHLLNKKSLAFALFDLMNMKKKEVWFYLKFYFRLHF